MPDEKVLIVESDPTFALVTQGLLEDKGYRVVGIASTGKQAITLAMNERPDVILMSIRLKGDMDGIQTAQSIQSQLDIPIIYQSANIGDETLRRSKATKPFAYIFKPLESKQLFTTLETTLYRHTMERKIQKSEQWLNAVLNNIGEGVIAIDGENKVTFMNPIAASMIGWAPGEAVNMQLAQVFNIVDETTLEPLELFPEVEPERQGSTDQKDSPLLITKNGARIPIEITIAHIKDIQENIVGSVIAFRDIRERKLAEQEVRRQANRAEALARVASRLSAQLDLSRVMHTVCAEAAQALDVPITAVMLYDRKREVYDIAATFSLKEEHQRLFSEFEPIPRLDYENFLARSNEPVSVIDDIQHLNDEANRKIYLQANLRTLAFAVMYQDDEIIGTLNVATVGEGRQFSPVDLFFIKGLADQAAVAIKNAQLFEQVRSGRERMQLLSRKLVEVQEAERRFLARELHDQIGQVLTGLQLSLEGCKRLSGDALLSSLEESQFLVASLMGQIRELSLRLRPAMLDDMGLIPTLVWYFEKYHHQVGVPVEFHHSGMDKRLPPELETAVYRIIQEALTNCARYAKADRVKVECISNNGFLRVSIQDNGLGFQPDQVWAEKKTFGLAGMRERANLLGGKLEIISAPGKGTHVIAGLPIDRPYERRKHERNRLDS